MLMDPMGGIVMTNDGNAILREVISCLSVSFYPISDLLLYATVAVDPSSASSCKIHD